MDARFLAIKLDVILLQHRYEGWKICKDGRMRQTPSKSILCYGRFGASYVL